MLKGISPTSLQTGREATEPPDTSEKESLMQTQESLLS